MKMLLLEYCQDEPRLPAGNKKGWTSLPLLFLCFQILSILEKLIWILLFFPHKSFWFLEALASTTSQTISLVSGAGGCRQKSFMLWFCRMRCREMCFRSWDTMEMAALEPCTDPYGVLEMVAPLSMRSSHTWRTSQNCMGSAAYMWFVPIKCRSKRTLDQNTASGSPSMKREYQSSVVLSCENSVVGTFTNCRIQRRWLFLSTSQRSMWCKSVVPLISGQPNRLVLHQEIWWEIINKLY